MNGRFQSRAAHLRLFAFAAALQLMCGLAQPALAQAGGAGAAGSGAAGAASGQGASGSAPGGQAGGQGAGQAGGSTGGAHGGNAAGAPAAPGAPGGQSAAQNSAAQNSATQNGAQAYAASASPASDPRKPPPAKPGALTLQQAVERARMSNPTLLAANANLRSVRAQEIQAAVRANPYLGVVGTEVTETSANAGNPYVYSVQLSRLFERGNKRAYRIEDARATTAQTAAQLQDAVRQTVLQVQTAFTHMLFAKQSLDLSTAQLADFSREVEIANDRFKAGDLGKLDFERLDLQLGNFESDVANSRIAVQQASDQLQTLLGVAQPSTTFDITGAIVPPPVTQTREQFIQQALVARPDLAAAQSGVVAAQAAYRLAIANGTADPTLELEYDRTPEGTNPDGSALNQNTLGFNVNFPLRIFDKNQGNKETARLSIDAAQLNVTAVRNQLVSDVDQAFVAYVQAKTLSDRFGNHYLDESADVLSIARYAFDHGGLALIDYLDSLRDARSSTSNALNAYQQTWLAVYQLTASSTVVLLP